jgi:alkyldihydroxyacetonephosphate synthase
VTERLRSWWGWGWADQALTDEQCRQLTALLPEPGPAAPQRPDTPMPVPDPAELRLPEPRVAAPRTLERVCTTAPLVRAAHTRGMAYRDLVHNLRGAFEQAPDLVAFPRTEADVVNLLDWAGSTDVAVVPYGGGSSVVGGLEYRAPAADAAPAQLHDGPAGLLGGGRTHRGHLSLDMSRLDRVLEVDPMSCAARIQAGVLGPALEDQLRPHGLTLRHFPQSFEFSSLGGWLATRAGGHYATLHTHIDDLVESLRVVTPAGPCESWRLPGSGAGPSPDRLFLGSEGALGVITSAWLRLQRRPVHRASAAVHFASVADAVQAVRAIAQSGLHPANCRLLDPTEARVNAAAQGGVSVLVLGFESPAIPVDGQLAAAVELAAAHRGEPAPTPDAVRSWRSAFLRMPYLRDGLVRMSVLVETFETACTWDRFDELYERVRADVGAAIRSVCGAPGLLACRFTHVYPDGPAPYFTVLAPGRRGAEVAMWDELKAAASEAVHAAGGTITHHHAVGRDHRPWYDRQRPEPFAAALCAAKRALDPRGILNPGVLVG